MNPALNEPVFSTSSVLINYKANSFTVVSKIAKPKAQSEDRELSNKTSDNGTVRLQQIGIEPAPVNITTLSLPDH